MNKQKSEKISQILKDSSKVTAIIQEGIRKALLQHKHAGNPVCTMKNGKVVWIPPEQIPE